MADEHDHGDGELCRDCGTMQVHRRLLDTDRNYARRLARIEDHAFRTMHSGVTMRSGCTRIPVVVHVVHRTAAENISQAQIDSQMAVLNADFRKKNADIAQVPAPFAPLAADARIEFVLASVDPDGNPTDGVTRTATTATGFGTNDDIKSDATGGKDPWDPSEYLNIWVGNLTGGLLGYAQFPGGPVVTDGVVVTHRGFGTTGTAQAPFNKGRTLTHEIGHWLNLRHIWGDDGTGCSGSDFVADTPNQGGANTGKPTFPKLSCNNGPNGDMFMNYMDYVDDDTMVMFTEGQVTRMQACLDGPRSSIGETIPCVTLPPKALPKDGPKEFPKDGIKDWPKDGPKDWPKDPGKELPKDPPKEFAKDFTKDPPKDIPKDGIKDWPKDGPWDPGPGKGFVGDPGPGKSVISDPGPGKGFVGDPGPGKGFKDPGPGKGLIADPGPGKGFKDPGPGKGLIADPGPGKGFKDPGPASRSSSRPRASMRGRWCPVTASRVPPMQPMPMPMQPMPMQPGPMQPMVQPNMPFVIGTGVAPGAQPPQAFGMHAAAPDPRAMVLQQYGQMLASYADLHQRGLLDEQGLMGWQQTYAAYAQMGGQ